MAGSPAWFIDWLLLLEAVAEDNEVVDDDSVVSNCRNTLSLFFVVLNDTTFQIYVYTHGIYIFTKFEKYSIESLFK